MTLGNDVYLILSHLNTSKANLPAKIIKFYIYRVLAGTNNF